MRCLLKFILIGAAIIPFFGCKKYTNDPFFSTYSPEARLTKGDSCVWTCVKYFSASGIASDVPPFHYSLSLNKDNSGIVGFSDLGSQYEISNNQEWSLNANKGKLTFFGEHEIKKLTMNQLELSDALGNVYYFEKRKKQGITSMEQGMMNIPLFGLFEEIVSLKGINTCSSQDAVQASNGSSSLGLVQGVLGNGIGGGSTVGEIKNNSFSFSQNFQKPGYITVWIENYGIGPVVMLNGVAVNNIDYLVGSSSPGQASSWCNIKIRIDSPGYKTVSISGNTGSITGAVSAIDEIRYWEIQ